MTSAVSAGANPSDYAGSESSIPPEAVEALLRTHEFDAKGYCLSCSGWMVSPNGSTPRKHTKDCAFVALARTLPNLVARCAELEGENERLKWTLNSEQLRADQLLKDRQAAEREVAALRSGLQDIAKRGLNCDLIPTHDMSSVESAEKFWHGYLRRMDTLLRDSAQMMLDAARAGGNK